MKRKYIKSTDLAVLTIVGINLVMSSAMGAAALYEPFAFESGDTTLSGNTGGSGLTGTWTAPSGSTAEAANLTYGSLSTSGSATVATGWNASSPYVGIGGTSLNGLLGHGGDLWFSLLYQAPSSGSIRFTFGIGDAPVTINGDLDGTDTSAQAIGFSIPFNKNAFPVMWETNNYDGGNVQNAPLGLTSGTGLSIPRDGATHLFVVHAEWGADGAANDKLTLYAPGTNLIQGTPFASVEGVVSQEDGSFDTLFFSADQSVGVLDEIRIGATYADVTPVPEPSSTALLGLGGLALLLRRRR